MIQLQVNGWGCKDSLGSLGPDVDHFYEVEERHRAPQE